jgi:hypothetical protein
MDLLLGVFEALAAGYVLAMAANLSLTFLIGRMGSKWLRRRGEVKTGFYVVTALAWLAASIVGTYITTAMAPFFPLLFAGITAAILVAILINNERELGKQQPNHTTLLSVCCVAIGAALGIFGAMNL